jgi:membrane-associated protease RseP (regulator of RpoE activity)
MSFFIYDMIFLALFIIFVVGFLWKERKKLGREMKIVFLYKTQIGVKIMDKISNRYRRFLKFLKWVIIVTGYILMGTIIFYIGQSVYIYFRYSLEITQITKSPPLVLLIPYFPKIFGLESFLPPFPFTYFILAVAIVTIVHEGAHGIFMRLNKVKIKSTGLAFFGPILGAFVEQDEKSMKKIKKTDQMAIIGAGVFANILTAGIFFLIWWALFLATFIPSGAMFNTPMTEVINISTVSMIGGINVINSSNAILSDILEKNNLTEDLSVWLGGEELKVTKIESGGKKYFMSPDIIKQQLKVNSDLLIVFGDFPAINAGLRGTIIELDDKKIRTYKELSKIMEGYKPGDSVVVKTDYNDEILEYNIVLAEDPNQKGRAVFGIGNSAQRSLRIDNLAFFKDNFTEYNVRNSFLEFLYYLAFWIFLINLLVGLFNMLPFAILDGGLFFYITLLGITKNEKLTKTIYKSLGYIILLSLFLMMAIWVFRMI